MPPFSLIKYSLAVLYSKRNHEKINKVMCSHTIFPFIFHFIIKSFLLLFQLQKVGWIFLSRAVNWFETPWSVYLFKLQTFFFLKKNKKGRENSDWGETIIKADNQAKKKNKGSGNTNMISVSQPNIIALVFVEKMVFL